jgi:hypothetical protein
MHGFILHSEDCTEIIERLEVSHPDLLVPADAGFVWTETPTPVAEWTVELADGEPQAVLFVPTPDEEEILLVGLDKRLQDAIDASAGLFRERFITTVPGQEMTYLEKERQARAWLADPAPDPNAAQYSMLKAEADGIGVTIDERVPVIIAQADAWRALGSRIEGLRMGAKAAVLAASTRAEKEAAANVNWGALA